jgi:hypothetical protein
LRAELAEVETSVAAEELEDTEPQPQQQLFKDIHFLLEAEVLAVLLLIIKEVLEEQVIFFLHLVQVAVAVELLLTFQDQGMEFLVDLEEEARIQREDLQQVLVLLDKEMLEVVHLKTLVAVEAAVVKTLLEETNQMVLEERV